jgi:hypothetical protein
MGAVTFLCLLFAGGRSLKAFVDPADVDTSASLVITPIPADYTRLSSFGLKENLRDNLLPAGDEVMTDVINEKIFGETYSLEYVVSAQTAPTRHVYSIFALKPQESVVGLVVQTTESRYSDVKNEMESIVNSLNLESGSD